MKTLIYCIPLYVFTLVCVSLLLKALIPVVKMFFVSLSLKRYLNYILTGFLTISVLYVIVTSLFI